MSEQIVILDGGSQYCKLIDKNIRKMKIKSEIMGLDVKIEKLKKYKGIIITGSPKSVIDNEIEFDYNIFKSDIPILGICYGMQLMSKYYGGEISNKEERTDGQYMIEIEIKSKLFDGLNNNEKVLLTHGDSIIEEPKKFKIIAKSENKKIIYGIEKENQYGLQFHPEVNLTENGNKIIENFIYKICKCKKNYDINNKYDEIKKYINEEGKNKNIISLVSGGVDSTVCTTLLYKILGKDKVYSLHIDNGFMRKDESKIVYESLKKKDYEIKVIDGSNKFYEEINNETNPEKIRKIIGDTFIKIMNEEINKLENKNNYILAQGTLRPDLIESGSKIVSKNANIIKTHHNDTEMVRKMREEGKIIEPLKNYHKDEVREIGRKLGLPEKLINRHPFPGPGLAIRIICEEYRENYEYINNKLNVFRNSNISLYLLPIRSVGVQGDGRSYKYVCGISTFIGWNELIKLAKKIPKIIKEINRVVYIFNNIDNNSNINNIYYTSTNIKRDTVEIVREADNICQNMLDKNSKISQMPIILLPLSFNIKNKRSIVIRTIITDDYMTGVVANPDIDLQNINKIVKEIMKMNNISRVCYDLTSKPPGTTEWL